MRAEPLLKHAAALLGFLKSSGYGEVTCDSIPSNALFINVYRTPLPTGVGVYLFSFPNEAVFYIGKTEAERDDFARIWNHLGSAPRILLSGERGFPKSKFAVKFDPDTKEYEAVRAGHFCVDYLAVKPPCLASLFEVYLQTIYVLEKGRLPVCNKQIG
jgi:hypothetical protein